MKKRYFFIATLLAPLSLLGQEVRLDSIVVEGRYKIDVDHLPEGKKLTLTSIEDPYCDQSLFFNYLRTPEGHKLKYNWYQEEWDDRIQLTRKIEFDMQDDGVNTISEMEYYWMKWQGKTKKIYNSLVGPAEQDVEEYGWKDELGWTPSNKRKEVYDEYHNNCILSEAYQIIDDQFVCFNRKTLGPNVYFQSPGTDRSSKETWLGELRNYDLDENNNLVCTYVERHLHDDYSFELQNWRYKNWEYGTHYEVENGHETVTLGDVNVYYQPGLIKTWSSYNGPDYQSVNRYNIIGQPLGLDDYRYSGNYIIGDNYYFWTTGGATVPYTKFEYTGVDTDNVVATRYEAEIDEWGYNSKGDYGVKKYHYNTYVSATWKFDHGHLVSFSMDPDHPLHTSLQDFEARFDAAGHCLYLKTAGLVTGIYEWGWDENGICSSYKHYDYYNPSQLLEAYSIDLRRDERGRLLLYDAVYNQGGTYHKHRVENAYRGDEQIKHLIYDNDKLVSGWNREYNAKGQCVSYSGFRFNLYPMATYRFSYDFDQYGNVTKESIDVLNGMSYQMEYEYDYSRPAPNTNRLAYLHNDWYTYTYIFPADTEIDEVQHCVKSCKVTKTIPYEEPEVYTEKYYYSDYTTTDADLKAVVRACLINSGDASASDVVKTVNKLLKSSGSK